MKDLLYEAEVKLTQYRSIVTTTELIFHPVSTFVDYFVNNNNKTTT